MKQGIRRKPNLVGEEGETKRVLRIDEAGAPMSKTDLLLHRTGVWIFSILTIAVSKYSKFLQWGFQVSTDNNFPFFIVNVYY